MQAWNHQKQQSIRSSNSQLKTYEKVFQAVEWENDFSRRLIESALPIAIHFEIEQTTELNTNLALVARRLSLAPLCFMGKIANIRIKQIKSFLINHS
jgi:hypothetical protein